jgi:hypothetical protein
MPRAKRRWRKRGKIRPGPSKKIIEQGRVRAEEKGWRGEKMKSDVVSGWNMRWGTWMTSSLADG